MRTRQETLSGVVLVLALVLSSGCDEESGGGGVPAANQPPDIGAIPDQSAVQGTPFGLDLTAYLSDDTDAAADLTLAPVSGGGAFTGVVYENTFAVAGNVTVEFIVMDTEGAGTSASFSVTVAAVANDPPTVAGIPDQTATVDSTFALDLAGYVSDDHDADKDLVFSVTSGGGSFSGTVYLNTFTSTGSHTVQFLVADTGGQTANGSFAVLAGEPTPSNEAPTISAIPGQNAAEGSLFTLDLTSYVNDDHDGLSSLTFAVVSGGGSFSGSVYENTFMIAGSVTVEFVVMDTEGASTTASFAVAVAASGPSLSPIGPQTVDEGSLIEVVLSASDPNDGQTLVFFKKEGPSWAAVAGEGTSPGPVSGTLTLAAGANDTGDYTVVVCVTDGRLYAEETVQITVQAANSAPVLSPVGPQTVAEDASLDIPLSATDPDVPEQTLTFSMLSGPAWASVTGSGPGSGAAGTLTLAPPNGVAGEHTVVVRVSDGADVDEETVQVSVDETNYPPELLGVNPVVEMSEDSVNEVAIVATDPDGDQITYSVVSGPSWATIVMGLLRLAPPNNTVSSVPGTVEVFEVVVYASDGGFEEGDQESVMVTVYAVNFPPELAAIGPQAVPESGSVDILLSATDPDDDQILFFTKVSGPAWATVTGSGPATGASGTLSLSPPAGTMGEVHTVMMKVDDGTDAHEVSVEVTVDFSADTIFVSPSGEDTSGNGDRASPCRTISYGISRAQALGSPRVVVASGVYVDTVDLVSGIDLLGGYDPTFATRDLAAFLAVIRSDGSANCTVRAVSVTAPTVFEGFVVEGPNVTTDSTNSIGILLQDCSSILTVQSNEIHAGVGGDGAAGADGQHGSDGVDGSPGLESLTIIAPPIPGDANPGGAGGSLTAWDATSLAGGKGGDATYAGGSVQGPDWIGTQQAGGDAGDNGGGAGGAGGYDGALWDSGNQCLWPANGPMDAGQGQNGAQGSHGLGGLGAPDAGSVATNEWVAAAGQPGENGTHGGGAGGGGAGGGAYPLDCTREVVGSSGGGGGSGGEGGRAGQSGGGGGGAFGLFVSFTVPSPDLPVIQSNSIYCGVAGDGGSGGSGAAGGRRGEGGSAGGRGSGVYDWAAGLAGNGGAGGDGGHGGGGGGGAGGISTGIFVHGYVVFPIYELVNTIDTGTGQAGARGEAGLSPAGGASDGQPGADGTVSDVNY